MEYNDSYRDAYVRLSGTTLTVGNSLFERSWNLSGKLPSTGQLTNKKTGKQWLSPGLAGQFEVKPDGLYAFFRQGITAGGMRIAGAEACTDDDLGIGKKHLKLTVHLTFGTGRIDWIHLIYPELPVHRNCLRVMEFHGPLTEPWNPEWPENYIDHLPLAPIHMRWKSVAFTDKSDDNDNPVIETRGIMTRRETRLFRGNLLLAEEIPTGEGLWMVKEGPSVTGSFTGEADIMLKGMQLYAKDWGFGPEDVSDDLTTYGSAVVLYDGGEEGALRALHEYSRAVHAYIPERDALIMSNTWGDGNADGRIGEAFLMKELYAAEQMGITCFQIDDGWENGRTINSVEAAADGFTWCSGYYRADPDFWSVDKKRLPNGLTPITDYASAHGIRIGLWFSADAEDDYGCWERDADTLLKLHRDLGVTAFKMDGINFGSKRAEENFTRLMRKVIKESGGKVIFNLDTTAGTRSGYFGRVQYGNLFLENRFTNPFGIWPNYWPHHTLRNLWLLSRYIPSERFQIEFLNVDRNTEHYDDPLSPANWGQEAAFAVSMFASPLAWMEMSSLASSSRENLSKVIKTYRPLQSEILSGQILPIGNEPDGFSFTGLQSVLPDGEGYLLLFRECAEEDECSFRLWGGLEGKILLLEPVLGSCCQREAETDADGRAEFRLADKLEYALYRYKTENRT